MQVSLISLTRCAVRTYPTSVMRYIPTFEGEVISIDAVMQRMANSLHMEWQKRLKLYSRNMATMHPDTAEHLSHYLFMNINRLG